MSKYAPANPAGLKPYVVTIWQMGREYDLVRWANTSAEARPTRIGTGQYVKSVRRALPDEVEPEDYAPLSPDLETNDER